MGILNVTPDSFYDGGRYLQPESAVAHAQELFAQGADILDAGAESSRPGAKPVGAEEEWARLEPVLARLSGFDIPISVDTYRASTARRALACGAAMVNDITALTGDPAMAGVVAEAGCSCVLMHMRGTPETMQDTPHYDNVTDTICAFFEERIAYAVSEGIAEEAIWLDPGFGFGKLPGHNLEMLDRLGEFKRFGRPVLIGTSNKSTIGNVLGLPPDKRSEGNAATVAVAISNGADAVRVHDVEGMVRVVRMTDAIVRREVEAGQR